MQTNQLANQLTSELIFLVGPTASGKSALAFELANQINANILVADSRQIFKDIPITSGADIPTKFSFMSDREFPNSFFSDGKTELHGVSFLDSNDEWSLGLFHELAQNVIRRTLSQRKVLIIVGGTGLYTHALLLDEEQIIQPPSKHLREQLHQQTLEQLQHQISALQPHAQSLFNTSDWNNPRRLIRAIEILTETGKPKTDINSVKNEISYRNEADQKQFIQPQWFGIEKDKAELEQRIFSRVTERLKHGAINEVEQLMQKMDDKTASIFTATGVKEIIGFLSGQYSQEELVQLWTKREYQYAKRQLTWFKKRPYIVWKKKEELETLLLDT